METKSIYRIFGNNRSAEQRVGAGTRSALRISAQQITAWIPSSTWVPWKSIGVSFSSDNSRYFGFYDSIGKLIFLKFMFYKQNVLQATSSSIRQRQSARLLSLSVSSTNSAVQQFPHQQQPFEEDYVRNESGTELIGRLTDEEDLCTGMVRSIPLDFLLISFIPSRWIVASIWSMRELSVSVCPSATCWFCFLAAALLRWKSHY